MDCFFDNLKDFLAFLFRLVGYDYGYCRDDYFETLIVDVHGLICVAVIKQRTHKKLHSHYKNKSD